MPDFYLIGADEAAMTAALDAAGWRGTGSEGVPIDQPPRGVALDRVGVIQEPTGETETVTVGEGEDAVTYERPVYDPLPGYHVNIRLRAGDLPPALAALEIPAPKTPHRVWL